MGQSPLPLLAHVSGDPCGISPELTARLVADSAVANAARLVVIGDARAFKSGCRDAGLSLELPKADAANLGSIKGHALLDLENLDPATIKRLVARGRAVRSAQLHDGARAGA